jgi:hypothetical protein
MSKEDSAVSIERNGLFVLGLRFDESVERQVLR